MQNDADLGRFDKKRGLIRYTISNMPKSTLLTYAAVVEQIQMAFQKWQNSSNFDFVETTTDDWDFLLDFGPLPPEVMAAVPNALAHADEAYAKRTRLSPAQRTITFNDDKTWDDLSLRMRDPSRSGPVIAMVNPDLMTCAMHEIGHALGLGHNADPSSIMQEKLGLGSTIWYHPHGKPLPDVDGEALAALYAVANPALDADLEGYAIVGSTFWMTAQGGGGSKDVPDFCWGVREGTPGVSAFSAYGFNPFLRQEGYGYMHLHLMRAEEVFSRPYVIGGGVVMPTSKLTLLDIPSPEQYKSEGLLGTTAIRTWGQQGGRVQFCARARCWNDLPLVDYDTDSLVYFVLGEGGSASAPPMRLVGFDTAIGTQEHNSIYYARSWMPPNADKSKLTTVNFATGRTWPDDPPHGDVTPYGNALGFAYMYFSQPPRA